jgi:hypothetical protein
MQAHCLRKACPQVSKAECRVVWVARSPVLICWRPESLLVQHGFVTYQRLVPGPVRHYRWELCLIEGPVVRRVCHSLSYAGTRKSRINVLLQVICSAGDACEGPFPRWLAASPGIRGRKIEHRTFRTMSVRPATSLEGNSYDLERDLLPSACEDRKVRRQASSNLQTWSGQQVHGFPPQPHKFVSDWES